MDINIIGTREKSAKNQIAFFPTILALCVSVWLLNERHLHWIIHSPCIIESM